MRALSELKKYYNASLSHYSESELQAIYGIVLEYFAIDKIASIVDPEMPISEEQAAEFKAVVDRLKQDEPIQYILGEAPFCGLQFYVDENVLVPRPETEELVHWIVEMHGADFAGKILDIGTGSGCIALALDHLMGKAAVTATDVSEGAVAVARRNAKEQNAKAEILQDDICEWINNKYSNFDIIISNPPYIDLEEKDSLYKNVLDFEPHLALFAPAGDTLFFYRLIVDFAKRYLNPDGYIYFEMSEFYADGVAELLQKKGFGDIELKKDLNGKGRMIRARQIFP